MRHHSPRSPRPSRPRGLLAVLSALAVAATGLLAVAPPGAAAATSDASGSASSGWTATGTGDSCTGIQLLGNPGFETGSAAPWTTTAGVIDNAGREPAHSGGWKAWLGGYGSSHTDTLSQSVALAAGCRATLGFYLHIGTAESGATAYDRLTVSADGTTLAAFSNLDAAPGYTLRGYDLSAFAGRTVTITFTGTEDPSLQTTFTVDDTLVRTS
ncbi:hypothetical protein OG618_01385 [Kitasatospora sp. NBC_01246]|uniref:hypothetical protein n=1 Tax=Kitasatospora sp. NBC_01246 TaxID=2903570 RepID=UPI002E36F18B|nr:hypothetical protein [Kitasatospora sp. NBC_01246]